MRFLVIILFLQASVFVAVASEEVHHTTEKHEATTTEADDSKSFIAHHVKDSYDFGIWHAMGWEFPLPIILIDNGLHVFSSGKFHHGDAVAASKGNYYKIFHGKIYKTDAKGTITLDEHHHVTNAMPLDFSITKTVVSIMFMVLLMFVVFARIARSYKNGALPKNGGKFLEPLIIFVRDEIAIPNIGEHQYKKYMSHLLTVFFFIWFSNLAGLLPLGINVTGNIAVTFSLAIVTFLITQFTAKKNYWKHVFWMPGVPVPMKFILAPIELLGVFIKPFALMIRLYANILAGHIVLMSLVALLYVFSNWFAKGAFLGLTFFLSILELLVAFLQAYIFTMLTALYFGAASAQHEEH